MSNKDAWGFYLEHLPVFKELTQPIIDFGVKDFGYWRIYADGTYIPFLNNSDFIHEYLQRITTQGAYGYDKLKGVLSGYSFFLLNEPKSTINLKKDSVLEMLWDNQIWNALCLFDHCSDGYIDCYSFYLSSEKEQSDTFFLSNLMLFQQYVKFFQSRIKSIVTSQNPSIRARFQDDFGFIRQCSTNKKAQALELFLSNTANQRTVTRKDGVEVKLSAREQECLSYLLEFRSVKEIARLMDLSPRTIETHIQNMRSKSGASSKHELIRMSGSASRY